MNRSMHPRAPALGVSVRRPRRMAAAAAALAIGLSSGSVTAQPMPERVVELPAQPLATSLGVLARDVGLPLHLDPAQIEGRSAPAISGRMTLRQALDVLLSGSGLVADVQAAVSSCAVRRIRPASPVRCRW